MENVNRIAVDAYELGVSLNATSIEQQRTYDHSNVAAYISPEPLPPQVEDNPEYQEGLKVCSLSYLFQNYGFNQDYVNLAGPRSFIGMADSGIFCNGPARLSPIFIRPLNISSYECPASSLPISYPDWNEKWYSPLCRGWYR